MEVVLEEAVASGGPEGAFQVGREVEQSLAEAGAPAASAALDFSWQGSHFRGQERAKRVSRSPHLYLLAELGPREG